MGDVAKLFMGELLQAFAGVSQLLVDLNGLLGHQAVGFLRTAGQQKVGAGRQSFVPVCVQPQANHEGSASHFPFTNIRHAHRLMATPRRVNSAETWVVSQPESPCSRNTSKPT